MNSSRLSQQNEIRVVLFDVGGVLVELSGLDMLLSWMPHQMTPEQAINLWLTSPTVRAFETGRIEPEVFVEQVISELALPVGREKFLAAFCTWGKEVLPGAVELVRRVPRKYVRATLCNTNFLHWPNLMCRRELCEAFDHHFASHLTGKIKPDEEAFEHVLATLDCSAPEVLFMDDSRLNVDAAKRIGINAFQVKGPLEAERVLREAGVLRDNSG